MMPGSTLFPESATAITPETSLLVGLAGIGVPAKAKPIILLGLQARDPALYAASARAAGRLGPAAADLVPLLLRGLNGDVAGMTMNQFLDSGCGFISVNSFRHGDMTSPRVECILALGRIGPAASAAIPFLTEIADHAPLTVYEAETGVAARQALMHIQKDNGVVPISTVIRSVKSPVSILNARVPEFKVTDLQGKVHSSTDWHGKMVLVVFADTSCPCVPAYAQRVKTLAARYGKKGLQIVYVFSHPEENRKQVARFVAEAKYPWLAVQDPGQKLTELFNARVWTESFLLDKEGVLRYRGRIDDSIFEPDIVKERSLENAVVALLNDRKVRKPATKALGCAIPRLGVTARVDTQ